MSDDIDIAQERAIADDTSPETWQEGIVGDSNLVSSNGDDIVGVALVYSDRNLRFIARARTLVPRLLDALEQARKERDEALDERMRSERDHYRESYHRELGRANRYLAQAKADQAERDALRQQLEAVTRERDEARAAGAWKPSEVWREEAANETAEAIASWFESLIRRRPNMYVGEFYTANEVVAHIRDGAWRAKEGK